MFIDLLNFSKALCLYKLKDHEVTCTVQTYIHHIHYMFVSLPSVLLNLRIRLRPYS